MFEGDLADMYTTNLSEMFEGDLEDTSTRSAQAEINLKITDSIL